MSIDLLRHGDTAQRSYRGQLDDALSELGWSQLRQAVDTGHWDAIVSSSMRRCAAFAHELADQRGVPLRLDPRLVEYHFGEWQGVPVETIAAEQGDALGRFWADPVGATFDGDALGGVEQPIVDGRPLYAGVSYAAGVREERITTLIQGGGTDQGRRSLKQPVETAKQCTEQQADHRIPGDRSCQRTRVAMTARRHRQAGQESQGNPQAADHAAVLAGQASGCREACGTSMLAISP